MSTIELIASRVRSALFGEYLFAGIELEQEEKVVEKYTRYGVEYLMTIEKMGGVKNGKAEMVDEVGRFIASLTFTNGNLTGPCILRSTEGIIMFEGNLLNGEKNGLCREYDERGDEVFEGVYMENRRIPFFEEIPDKPGFFVEHSREDLHAMAYTQYDVAKKEKNGICFWLNSAGQVSKEVHMRGEEEVEKIRVFENAEMIEYAKGGKVIYKGGYCGDWKNGFKRHGEGTEYDGSSSEIATSKKVYEGGFVNNNRAVIYTAVNNGCFRGYFEEKAMDGKRLSYSQLQPSCCIKHGRSIEFSLDTNCPVSEKLFENGKIVLERVRVHENRMSEYDEGGNEIYKGEFTYLDGEFLRWGKGIEFESTKVIKYDGDFVSGYYHGKGTLYRNGRSYFKGEWVCGFPEGDGNLYGEDGKVQLKGKWHLGYLNGVDYETVRRKGLCSCFLDPRETRVNEGMRRIRINEEKKRKEEAAKREREERIRMEEEVGKRLEERKKRGEEEKKKREEEARVQREEPERYWKESLAACLKSSPDQYSSLEEFVVARGSMNMNCGNLPNIKLDFSQFSRLKRIEIGSYGFSYIREFVLDGLMGLETVKIDMLCFCTGIESIPGQNKDGLFRIANCPNLGTLEIGDNSFRDFNQFELVKVNSLQTIKFGTHCFWYTENCTFESRDEMR